MIFWLFKKNSGCIEKEIDNLIFQEDEEVEDNKLAKALTYLQNLIKI
jgi:hypothetical protein